MRVATFNVLHGRSVADGRVEVGRLAAAVAGLDADVLGLQEVDLDQPRSGSADLTAVAAQAVGARAFRFAPAVVGTPGEQFRPWRFDGDGAGEPCYGVSLISRWPVLSWQITRLPGAPVRSPVLASGGGVLLLRDEPRVLLAAVVDAPGGPLTVATTHLSFVPGWNLRQLRQAVRALSRLPAPRLLLGDLNLPAGLAGAVSRWRVLARAATYPGGQPRVQLDHVLAHRRGLAGLGPVVQVDAPAAAVSDHRPLVVQFAAPAGGSRR